MSGASTRHTVRAPSVTLRPATPEDCRQVWLWRNDPDTRRASFDSAPIPWAAHEAWFRRSLEQEDRQLWVVLAEGAACGMARLDTSGREAEVSINLAPEWRRRGVGPAALLALADVAFRIRGIERLVASVKPDNQASLSAFRKAGFTLASAGSTLRLLRTRHGD